MVRPPDRLLSSAAFLGVLVMKKKATPGMESIKLTTDGQEEEARPSVKVLFFMLGV